MSRHGFIMPTVTLDCGSCNSPKMTFTVREVDFEKQIVNGDPFVRRGALSATCNGCEAVSVIRLSGNFALNDEDRDYDSAEDLWV